MIPLFLFAVPVSVSAQTLIKQIIWNVVGTLQLIIGLLLVVATVAFLWGVILFIASSSNEQARGKAKGIMTWGIIGLAVMAVAWGVTTILVSYFGIPSGAPRMNPPPVFKDLF